MKFQCFQEPLCSRCEAHQLALEADRLSGPFHPQLPSDFREMTGALTGGPLSSGLFPSMNLWLRHSIDSPHYKGKHCSVHLSETGARSTRLCLCLEICSASLKSLLLFFFYKHDADCDVRFALFV